MLQLMKEKARECGVSLNLECQPALPAIRGDERKLKQILFNLLSNAIQFTPRGGSIAIWIGIDQSGEIELAVSDTGIRIAPGQIKHVLEPFTQVDSVYNRSHSGTGLGLTLAKELAAFAWRGVRSDRPRGQGNDGRGQVPESADHQCPAQAAALAQSVRSAE